MLELIKQPDDLQGLSYHELQKLADEIRQFLVRNVAATGGHLGPNLGVVELTLALHRIFESPYDAIIFDTGHQAYVHKLLTGRCAGFETLRQKGGLSGYPSRSESHHDWVESSHASASLSYADGLAKSFELLGEGSRRVVAVVGDGALTGGMCWEALNNIACAERGIVIVVNDNGRSYAPTSGALAAHLVELRLTPWYERVLARAKGLIDRVPLFGPWMYVFLHSVKVAMKDAVCPQAMFGDLGLKYVGPIDGHDQRAVEHALRRAKNFGGPVLVHVITHKGKGYDPAESDDLEKMHTIGVIDAQTGRARKAAERGWTAVFSEVLMEHAAKNSKVVGITAAMPGPTGMREFAQRFPSRVFDVGIAEQHAVTSAAGMAMGGLHPVVAIYSTFMNRAFDQVMMDVALHELPVTFVLDRAGITGNDGPSHNGIWDLSILNIVPGIRVAAPRDACRLREELGEALAIESGPTALRFPKGPVIDTVPEIERRDGLDILTVPLADQDVDILLIAVGACASTAVSCAERLKGQGVGVTVIDPRWVLPVSAAIVDLAARHRLVVTLEDNGVSGGVGSAVSTALRASAIDVPCRDLAVPQRFLAHASREEVFEMVGLSHRQIVDTVMRWWVSAADRQSDLFGKVSR